MTAAYIPMSDPRALRWETGIVWLESPENFRYVREGTLFVCSRARRPRSGVPTRLVAYSVLSPKAPSDHPGEFLRRVWWVASHDPYEGRGHPIEAVDPLRIRPGKPSYHPSDS